LWQSGDAGYDASNPYRNSLAKYVLPSYNEWYKAAYYNPSNSIYYKYATGSDTAPIAVAGGTDANTAVYGQGISNPADVNLAGGLSPYGVMGLSGNIWEWDETSGDLLNSSGSSFRGFRGGYWYDSFPNYLASTHRNAFFSTQYGGYDIGFRVASLSPSSPPPAVPEPSMMVIGTLLGLGGLMAKRRMKR
jgi:formylglycine-generating enzyme required for sulfatase activity